MKKIIVLVLCVGIGVSLYFCFRKEETSNEMEHFVDEVVEQQENEVVDQQEKEVIEDEIIKWSDEWEYADCSEIHEDNIILYRSKSENRKNKVVAINAGHGSENGEQYQTLCHPDGSAKVTGGSTAKGSIYALADSTGMTFNDGTPEPIVTLKLAEQLKEKLLNEGYDVLMLREIQGCHTDVIARTVFANQNADIHIALHYDSSTNDKGFFYISVPENEAYRSMEPVASHWQEHIQLGEALLSGMKEEGIKIFGAGSMPVDLMQTSFSTIPSVDVEVGDKASDISDEALDLASSGLLKGIDYYFQK